MFARRRPLSYASFIIFFFLAAVFLMIFIKMHAEMHKFPPVTVYSTQSGSPMGGQQQQQQGMMRPPLMPMDFHGDPAMMGMPPTTAKPKNVTINGTTTNKSGAPTNATKPPAPVTVPPVLMPILAAGVQSVAAIANHDGTITPQTPTSPIHTTTITTTTTEKATISNATHSQQQQHHGDGMDDEHEHEFDN
jgi:hypothetical protein